MQQTPLPSKPLSLAATRARRGRFIYIACPWSPAGGGMYKVADYLIRAQAQIPPAQAASLWPLDTRGPGSALASLGMLARAIGKLVRGRVSGELAGVHVNMAYRLSVFRKGSIVIASRALGIPVVIHLHAQMHGFYHSLPQPLRALMRWTFSLASGVVVIGSEARRFVTEELKVPASRVEIVLNGVPGPATAPVRTGERPVQRVLFVGRLCQDKGVPDLLNALARAPLDRERVRVTLAGSGELEAYRALAQSLGIAGFVEFAGWCEQPQVDALLREADLLVLPSHEEVMPLVVLEALAHAVPVVCTPVGELPHALGDGTHAFFVPVGDVDALARGIATLLGDAALRERLARNGRLLYEREFSLPHFFEHVARVHQRRFGVAARAEPAPVAPPTAATQNPAQTQTQAQAQAQAQTQTQTPAPASTSTPAATAAEETTP
jgi:glycosyltransferase involved in cell wall biosynthesis